MIPPGLIVLAALFWASFLAITPPSSLQVGGIYQGSHLPDDHLLAGTDRGWLVPPGTLKPKPNHDNGVDRPGMASFRDNRTSLRFFFYRPCPKAFGDDPAQVDYEFVLRAKFYVEGSGIPSWGYMDYAVAEVGFHDESGTDRQGKQVMLGFFLSDKPRGYLGKRVIGFRGANGQLLHTIAWFDWLDGQVHEYRVKKYHAGRSVRVAVSIDGVLVDDSAVYSDLLDASTDDIGFCFDTSPFGEVNATIESIRYGKAVTRSPSLVRRAANSPGGKQ